MAGQSSLLARTVKSSTPDMKWNMTQLKKTDEREYTMGMGWDFAWLLYFRTSTGWLTVLCPWKKRKKNTFQSWNDILISWFDTIPIQYAVVRVRIRVRFLLMFSLIWTGSSVSLNPLRRFRKETVQVIVIFCIWVMRVQPLLLPFRRLAAGPESFRSNWRSENMWVILSGP